MRNETFMCGAVNTLNKDTIGVVDRLNDKSAVHRLHAALGMVTEAAEIADIVKKSAFYGKKLDKTHLKEEAGDLLYYIAVLLWNEGWTFEEVMKMNNEKLAARFPDKFQSSLAINKNVEAERKVLEGGCCGGKGTCGEGIT